MSASALKTQRQAIPGFGSQPDPVVVPAAPPCSRPRQRVLVSALACNGSRGSEALVAYKLVERLADRYDVTVLATDPANVPPGVRLVDCPAGPCELNDVGITSLVRFEAAQARHLLLRRLGSFDIVHRVTPAAITIPTLLPLLTSERPFVIGPLIAAPPPPAAFEPILRRPPAEPLRDRLTAARILGSAARRVAAAAERSAVKFRRASLILVGMEEVRRQLPDGLRDRCRFITWSGVEHDEFTPAPLRSDARPLRLLFAGRLVPYKGVELLLRAVAVARATMDVELDIVGSGEGAYQDSMRAVACELGLGSRVRFLPGVPRSELPDVYRKADVYCFPTLADTYGVALLEAMSCGLPVIVSDTGGPAEIVKPGDGIKIPLTDPDRYVAEYAAAIVALGSDPDLRGRLGASARRRMIADHDWDRIGRRLLDIYAELEQPK